MKRTIPATTTIICDICQRECGCGAGQQWRKMQTTIHIRQSGLDHLGDPCCKADRDLDLCDECASKLNGFIFTLRSEHQKNASL